MNNTMQYKGYVGSVEFSEADGLFFGKVLGIRALISYEGTNAAERQQLWVCTGRDLGIAPDRSSSCKDATTSSLCISS